MTAGPLFLGIEIGGTKLQVGLGAGDGRLLAIRRAVVLPERGAAGIREQVLADTRALLLGRHVPPSTVAGVGVGFGGPIDSETGVVGTSFQIDGWDGFPLGSWLGEALGIPKVFVANDADAAALGEARYGAGVGHNPLLYLTIGSGIGGGLVHDGRIYRWAGPAALEIGHLRIDGLDGGDVSEARQLEDVASGWAIGRRARERLGSPGHAAGEGRILLEIAEGDASRVTAATVAEAAGRGDSLASAVLDEATRAVGRALAHAVTLLAPGRIILGGGVSLIGERLWFGPIHRELDRRVFPPLRGTFDVVPPALGEEVVVHGAIALAGSRSAVPS